MAMKKPLISYSNSLWFPSGRHGPLSALIVQKRGGGKKENSAPNNQHTSKLASLVSGLQARLQSTERRLITFNHAFCGLSKLSHHGPMAIPTTSFPHRIHGPRLLPLKRVIDRARAPGSQRPVHRVRGASSAPWWGTCPGKGTPRGPASSAPRVASRVFWREARRYRRMQKKNASENFGERNKGHLFCRWLRNPFFLCFLRCRW